MTKEAAHEWPIRELSLVPVHQVPRRGEPHEQKLRYEYDGLRLAILLGRQRPRHLDRPPGNLLLHALQYLLLVLLDFQLGPLTDGAVHFAETLAMVLDLGEAPLAARPRVERIEVEQAGTLLQLAGHLVTVYEHRLVTVAIVICILALFAIGMSSTSAQIARLLVGREYLIGQIGRLVGHVARRFRIYLFERVLQLGHLRHAAYSYAFAHDDGRKAA